MTTSLFVEFWNSKSSVRLLLGLSGGNILNNINLVVVIRKLEYQNGWKKKRFRKSEEI